MLWQFIRNNQDADVAQLALQRKRYPMFSDSDFRFCLQQIEGRQRTKDKLPTFAQIDGWLYPPRLNLEQCSSERTARFKASLIQKLQIENDELCLVDGTGGYGVDAFFMSEVAAETHYFEQNGELAAVAEHNFHLAGKGVHCHPEPFSAQTLSAFHFPSFTVLYLDPARRDMHGGKVFRLEDCTPNVIDIVRGIREKIVPIGAVNSTVRVLLKLSPMLDCHQAIAQLGGSWDVYVVSVNNEVKELLLLSEGAGQINAVMLSDDGDHVFSFAADEESGAEVQYLSTDEPLEGLYVYEPDAALLKAGAFRVIGERYGLKKADVNTHLYFSDQLPSVGSQLSGLGRWWQVVGVYSRVKEVQRVCARANVLTRNYVLPAEALRKQLRLKDGGEEYIIGCRIADKPVLLHCRRVM